MVSIQKAEIVLTGGLSSYLEILVKTEPQTLCLQIWPLNYIPILLQPKNMNKVAPS